MKWRRDASWRRAPTKGTMAPEPIAAVWERLQPRPAKTSQGTLLKPFLLEAIS